MNVDELTTYILQNEEVLAGHPYIIRQLINKLKMVSSQNIIEALDDRTEEEPEHELPNIDIYIFDGLVAVQYYSDWYVPYGSESNVEFFLSEKENS